MQKLQSYQNQASEQIERETKSEILDNDSHEEENQQKKNKTKLQKLIERKTILKYYRSPIHLSRFLFFDAVKDENLRDPLLRSLAKEESDEEILVTKVGPQLHEEISYTSLLI